MHYVCASLLLCDAQMIGLTEKKYLDKDSVLIYSAKAISTISCHHQVKYRSQLTLKSNHNGGIFDVSIVQINRVFVVNLRTFFLAGEGTQRQYPCLQV